jgi:mono/diheme cytochrome c family protein
MRVAGVVVGVLALVTVSAAQAQRVGGTAASSAGRGNPERGRYLVENVAMCAECHSTRDDQGAIAAGTRFLGGPLPVRPSWASDWATRAPRIAGLPGYTDEQGIRLLTQGAIDRDGNQLRPPMPRFRMSPEDAAAVIAFLRTIR